MTRSLVVSLATAPNTAEARIANTVIARKCLTVSSQQRYRRRRASLDSLVSQRLGGMYCHIRRWHVLPAKDHQRNRRPSASKRYREFPCRDSQSWAVTAKAVTTPVPSRDQTCVLPSTTQGQSRAKLNLPSLERAPIFPIGDAPLQERTTPPLRPTTLSLSQTLLPQSYLFRSCSIAPPVKPLAIKVLHEPSFKCFNRSRPLPCNVSQHSNSETQEPN